jgi:hypothetical protein
MRNDVRFSDIFTGLGNRRAIFIIIGWKVNGKRSLNGLPVGRQVKIDIDVVSS